jgi:hypothetical protein
MTRKRCGNAPWKSRPRQARFPHSHSVGGEGGWKSGKPKTGFPLSHRHESSLFNTEHKHHERASRLDIGPDSTSWPDRSRPSGAADQRQTNERRHRAAAQFSGSLRIGIEEPFQAHLVLELILDFRLICGLENALWKDLSGV